MSNLLVVKDKVMRFAKELFAQVELGDDGGLIIPWNSTRVFINTFEREVDPENEDFWNENQLSRTAINIWAPTIFDVSRATSSTSGLPQKVLTISTVIAR